jgi:LPS export ABC transporter protein LptC
VKIAVSVCLPVLIFLSCGSDSKQKVATEFISSDYPTTQMWKMNTTVTDSGKVSSIIRAGYVAKYNRTESKITHLDSGLYVEFYDAETGKRTSVLTSGHGLINDLTNDMEAFDHVKVVSEDSTILQSEYLKWTQSTQLVSSDKFVTITTPTEVLQGTGFESDKKLKYYKIFKASGRADVDKK